jgi:hypothetical protein
MDSTLLFTSALGLKAPWQVSDIRFEPEQGEIHFDWPVIQNGWTDRPDRPGPVRISRSMIGRRRLGNICISLSTRPFCMLLCRG